jgi:chemotaxis protein CheC
MHMLGDLTGRTLLVFPKPTAVRLAELMLRRPPGSSQELGEMEQSAIKEAGNILSSAYMNALSDFMGMMLLPSPPSLAVDMSTAVLTTAYLQFGSDRDYVFCVESEFFMTDVNEKLRGFFLLLPDPASLQAILRAVRVA